MAQWTTFRTPSTTLAQGQICGRVIIINLNVREAFAHRSGDFFIKPGFIISPGDPNLTPSTLPDSPSMLVIMLASSARIKRLERLPMGESRTRLSSALAVAHRRHDHADQHSAGMTDHWVSTNSGSTLKDVHNRCKIDVISDNLACFPEGKWWISWLASICSTADLMSASVLPTANALVGASIGRARLAAPTRTYVV